MSGRKMEPLLTWPMLLAVMAVAACGVPDGQWVEQDVLVPSVADPDDGMLSIHIDGDLILVGGQFTNDFGAVVFARDGDAWVEEDVLAVDLDRSDSFGGATALSGETAVVGASGVEPGGAAFVFTRGEEWVVQQKLEPADPALHIGGPIAFSGDTVIFGNAFTGSVVVFERDDGVWTEQEPWFPDAPEGSPWMSLAISGDTAIVGLPEDEGVADVFARKGRGWRLQQRIAEDATGSQGAFGLSVDVSGNTALVGSRFSNGEYDTGVGYVFVRSLGRWHVQEHLAARGASIYSDFGWPVALDGDHALVAAPSEDDRAGAVYAFVRRGHKWTQIQRLTASDAAPLAEFGASLAISGDTAVVGTPSGSGVYVFEFEDP